MQLIGFIGQGWIGKNYADDFENRGYSVVRYALEEPYVNNREAIRGCDIVFVAVPTPTTAAGFDDSYVRAALKNVAPGSTVVIKSTLLPGTTEQLQADYPELFIMHSPEFLREASAAHDAAHPERNLIGIPVDTEDYTTRALQVLAVLPEAPYQKIMSARDAELVKYAGNCFLYTKVVFMNILYDLVEASGGNWDSFRDALVHDPRIGASHTQPVHASGHDTTDTKLKRGAGGHCFIKDFEAFRQLVHSTLREHTDTAELLKQLVMVNNRLLRESEKDLDLLTRVYGMEAVATNERDRI